DQLGLHVQGIEGVCEGDFVGLMLGDDGAKMHVDAGEANRQLLALQELDCAAGQAGERARGMNFDNPVAGVFSTAVDTENSHGVRFSLTRNMWDGLGGSRGIPTFTVSY